MSYEIHVIESETGSVVQIVNCKGSRSQAEKTERGLMVNMNHDRYHTEIVEVH